MRRLLAAAFVCTGLFYIEYTDLWRQVHIPFDLEGYHYSLADAAFLSLKAHRLPLWDPWQYAGIPLAGNIQAALFYPPSWLMYAVNLPFSKRLPFAAVELLLIAHIWLSFVLFYAWLQRSRGLGSLAAIAGAAVFAFSGYACSQITHLGLVCNYAWFPLGFWAIDDIALRDLPKRGVVKLTIAVALGFLAGYPSTWICFMVCLGCYALASVRSIRTVALSGLAVAWAIALCAVQLLPTLEAAPLKQFDKKYAASGGMVNPAYYYSFLVPNLYDFDLNVDVYTNIGKDYSYLGGLGIAGLVLFLIALPRVWRTTMPLFGALAGTVVILMNPGSIAGQLIEKSATLMQVFSDWYFLAGFFAVLSAFAAIGVDAYLKQQAVTRRAHWWTWLPVVIAAVAWSGYLLSLWMWHWRPFAKGWASATDAAIATALVFALLACWRVSNRKNVIAAALLLLGFADYKAFGTSRRFNTRAGPTNSVQSREAFFGFSAQAWTHIVEQQPIRATIDEWGPLSSDWRHGEVAIANGFDPFLPTAYQKLIESRKGVFVSNRLFNLPRDPETLRLLGVGFYVTAEQSPMYKELLANPNFRMYESENDYFKVFELMGSKPPYAFSDPQAGIRLERWSPERRRFEVTANEPGTFRMSEQFYPGWRATVDRKAVTLSRCETAFQCAEVPSGKHMVEFVYRPMSLLIGLAISVVAAMALMVFAAFTGLRSRRALTPAGRL